MEEIDPLLLEAVDFFDRAMEFGQLDEDKFDVVDGVVDEKGFFFEDEAGDDGVETGEHLEVGDGEGNDGIELLVVFADAELG